MFSETVTFPDILNDFGGNYFVYISAILFKTVKIICWIYIVDIVRYMLHHI